MLDLLVLVHVTLVVLDGLVPVDLVLQVQFLLDEGGDLVVLLLLHLTVELFHLIMSTMIITAVSDRQVIKSYRLLLSLNPGCFLLFSKTSFLITLFDLLQGMDLSRLDLEHIVDLPHLDGLLLKIVDQLTRPLLEGLHLRFSLLQALLSRLALLA